MTQRIAGTAEVPELARDALARIRNCVSPQRVILFGSWARGEADPDSDLDLLVVLPIKGPRHRVSISLLLVLADLPVAKDVVVLAPDEWERKKDVPGSIAYPAAHEGVVLYAA